MRMSLGVLLANISALFTKLSMILSGVLRNCDGGPTYTGPFNAGEAGAICPNRDSVTSSRTSLIVELPCCTESSSWLGLQSILCLVSRTSTDHLVMIQYR